MIRELCKDLRVLGKGDLAQLMKWRFKILRARDFERPKPVRPVRADGLMRVGIEVVMWTSSHWQLVMVN